MNIVPISQIDLNLVLADMQKAQEQSSLYAHLLNSKPGQWEVFDRPKEVRLEMVAGESRKKPGKAANTRGAGRQGRGGSFSGSDKESAGSGSLEAEEATREARQKANSELKKEEVS